LFNNPLHKEHKIGIIGCGRIAGWFEKDTSTIKPCKKIYTHVSAYRARKDTKIVGCCDRDMNKAKKFAGQFRIPYWTDSVKDLLAQDLDIVSICVPYHANLKVMQRIVKQRNVPKKIFLEKSIAGQLSDAKEIVALAKKRNIELYVNNRRLDPSIQLFKKVIDKEFNNEVVSVSAICSSGAHAVGIHMVDVLRYVFGDVEEVFAVQENDHVKRVPYSTNFNVKDPRLSGMIAFKSGLKASWSNFARTDFICFDIDVICKNGKARLSYFSSKKVMYQIKSKSQNPEFTFLLGKEIFPKYSSDSLFKKGVDEILEGQHTHSVLKGEEGLKSYAVLDALIQSARKGNIPYVRI